MAGSGWNYVNPVKSFMEGYKFWDDMMYDREKRGRERAQFEYEQGNRLADAAAGDLGAMVMRDDGVLDTGRFNELLKDQDKYEQIAGVLQTLPQFKDKKILGFAAEDMDGSPIGVVVTEDANGNRDIDAVRDPENPGNLIRLTPELVNGVFANVSMRAGGQRQKDYLGSRETLASERSNRMMIGANNAPQPGGLSAAVPGASVPSRAPATSVAPNATTVAPRTITANLAPSLQQAAPVTASDQANAEITAARKKAAEFQNSAVGSQAQAAQRQLNAAAELREKAKTLRESGLAKDAEKLEADAAEYEAKAKQLMDFAAKRTNQVNPAFNPANYDTPEGIDVLIGQVDEQLSNDPWFTIPLTNYGVMGNTPQEKLELLDRKKALEARKQLLLNGKNPDAIGLNAASAGPRTHDGYPARQNADGSVSTEVSITVTDPRINNGAPTNIPSLWEGVQRSEEESVKRAAASGKNYQAFGSIPEAVNAAKSRSAAGGASAPQQRQSAPVAQVPAAPRGRKLSEAEINTLAAQARREKWSPETLAKETRRLQGLPVDSKTTTAETAQYVLDENSNIIDVLPSLKSNAPTPKQNLEYETAVDRRIRDWATSRFGAPKAGETNPTITWAEGAARAAQREGIFKPEAPDIVDKLNRVTDMYIEDTDRTGPWNRNLTSDYRYQSLGPGLVALSLGYTDLDDAQDEVFEPAANIVGIVFKGASAQVQQRMVYKTIDLAAALTERGESGQSAWRTAINQLQTYPDDFARYKVGDLADAIVAKRSSNQ
jgi:hypothetical protein